MFLEELGEMREELQKMHMDIQDLVTKHSKHLEHKVEALAREQKEGFRE